MRLGITALVALSCGCGAQLSDGRDPSLGNVDPPTPDAGAGPDPAPTADAMPDAPPPVAQCTSRTVYLNFDGQDLTFGASDATLNQASWMTQPQGHARPYLAGNTDRQTTIQAITDGVTRQLSQFPIKVTRIRPATGNYVMIVFGGQPGDVGSNFSGGVNQLDCGDTRPNDLAWISDNVDVPQSAINTAIGAIGFGLGLTATKDPRDCLCGWANNCVGDDSGPCQLGSPIARDTKARQLCPDLTPQDEVAAFRTAFCQ